MRKIPSPAAAAAFFTVSAICLAGEPMRSVGEVAAAIEQGRCGKEFDVTARVLLAGRPHVLGFAAEDATGAAWFGTNPSIAFDCPTNSGIVVRLRGSTIAGRADGSCGADCRKIEHMSDPGPPEPIRTSAKAIQADRSLLNRLVRVSGTVHDIFRDDIDPRWFFVLISCSDGIVYWTLYDEDEPMEKFERIIGSAVAADGIVTQYRKPRTTIGHILIAHDFRALRTLGPPPGDPYDVPEISRGIFASPAKPTHVGRRRARGHVIALWHGDSILMRSTDGDLHRVSLKYGIPPRYGDFIEVLGTPETDLFSVNVSRAVWRPCSGPAMKPSAVRDLNAAEIFTDSWLDNSRGRSLKNASLQGQTVRIRGTVRGIPVVGRDSGRLYLESDSFVVPVDASGCPYAFDGVTAGCLVEVTGTYVAVAENLGASFALPQVREILIAVNSADGIKVIARPPWWTPGRMFSVIGALLSAICGIFVWNIALRKQSEQRGLELANEQLGRATSEFKVLERTRLAIELHDSLSQTLTGVSMGIDSAIDIAGDGSPELRRQLMFSSRAVRACRTELGNCLWDLRNQALEESDMNSAIRLATCQTVNRTTLTVRFSVPRERLSDNTAHAILQIIRELVSNAVRHGRATAVRIAGSIEDGKLRFSVADNGRGFDRESAPGFAEGHFGLQGIHERIERFDGEMEIESRPGHGTKVTVTINIPSEKLREEYGNG